MGGEVESSSILLFQPSLNFFPRGGTFLTKEKGEEERERGAGVRSVGDTVGGGGYFFRERPPWRDV